MFYIKITGKNGYYNGIQESGACSKEHQEYNNNQTHPKYDKTISLDILIKETITNYSYSIPLKKNITGLKSRYAFTTREAAEKEIEMIKNFKKNRSDYINTRVRGYYHKTYDRPHVPYYTKYTETADFTSFEKLADKCYIHEDNETLIPKQTRGKPEPNRISYREASEYGHDYCDICKVSLTTGEPYITVINRVRVCNGCILEISEALNEKFKGHPHAEEIKSAWQVERMMQD